MVASRKSVTPPKPAARDHLLAYTVGIVFTVLALGFGGTWLYLQRVEKLSANVNYLRLPPVAISRDGHSIAATMAIKTSGADAKWASDNKLVLEQVMKHVLTDVDPQRALAPGGLQTLQDTLKAASNVVLHTDKVQEVLVTDFLVSEGDF